MCGIVGYCGTKQAVPVLLNGLEKLEYRGYDSAGIAVESSGEIEVVKCKGRLTNLEKKLKAAPISGTCGIGHTRWATHGVPNETNAHPHLSDNNEVVLVHNGIIENYAELKEKLIKNGYSFYSETDTEVLTKLVDYYYKKYGTPMNALARVSLRAIGSFACCVMFKAHPNELYCIKKDSPMVVGKSDCGCFVASDVPALISYTKDVVYIEDYEMVKVTKNDYSVYTIDQEKKEKQVMHIDWSEDAAQKCGYPHFMLKEIYEQPRVLECVLNAYIKNNNVNFNIEDSFLYDIKNINIVACGSAYHAGLAAKKGLEQFSGLRVNVELASEFRYRSPLITKEDLVVLISQSGETADTLAALRLAKNCGAKTLGIVNVVGSSISREADKTIYTLAGPEVAVATTKAYVAQIMVLQLLAIKMAKNNVKIKNSEIKSYILELFKIPDKQRQVLQDISMLKKIAATEAHNKDAYFLGRGVDFATSLEAALKLKEISYIHCEGYAAGEMKHGSISLIEDGSIVIGLITDPKLSEKTISNLVEVKSRGAKVCVVTTDNGCKLKRVADYVIKVSETHPWLSTLVAIVPLQLLAYFVALSRGLDIDKPRNLAKSVTVE